MTELSHLLDQLDSAWDSLGFSSERWLAPGIDNASAREVLATVSGTPCQEALDWFAWRNGPRADRADVMLAPSGFTALSIEQGLAERASLIEMAAALADSPPDPLPTSAFWRDSWLPIGRISSAAVLVIDLAQGTDTAPVHNVDWQALDAVNIPVAPSLADAVAVWVSALSGGYYECVDGLWIYDFAAVPRELRKTGLIG